MSSDDERDERERDPFLDVDEAMNFSNSENNIFKIDTIDFPSTLFVHKNHTDKISFPYVKPKQGDSRPDEEGYIKYEYYGPNIRDCLQFSEGIACGRMGYEGEESQWKEKVTGEVFGVNLWHHTQLIKKPGVAQNEAAAPDVGEAYAIVSTIPKNKINLKTGIIKETVYKNGGVKYAFEKYPYHLAGVIAKDGGTRITLESFAPFHGNVTTDKPIFGIYELNEEYSDFHTIWSETEFFEDPKTIVLTPINPPKIKRSSPKSRRRSPSPKRRKGRK